MKTVHVTNQLKSILNVSILFLFIGIIAIGCKKNDDINEGNNNNLEDTRLKEWTYSDDITQENNRIEVIYENNRMSELLYYEIYSNLLMNKITVDYTGNKARVIEYYKQGDNFYIWNIKDKYFEGSKLVEERYYDELEPGYPFTGKTIYNYSNNLLSETTSYISEDNSEPIRKSEYYYENDRLIRIETLEFENNQYVISQKTTYEYENNQLSQVIGYYFYSGAWKYSYKDEFNYEGNVVFRQSYYFNNDEWQLEKELEAVLNDDGNTVKMTETDMYSNKTVLELTYEAGTGNFDGIILEPTYDFYPCLIPF